MPDLFVTGICLPRDLHALLRDAARGRQRANGGRVSASKIISELIDAHRGELLKDAARETALTANLPESAKKCK